MLDGRFALVTGAGQGIGAAVARRYVDEGAHVLLADISADAVQALALELGNRCLSTRADVAVEADVAAAVDLALAEFGRLDVMVNNAGILGPTGPVADLDMIAAATALDVNVHGVLHGVKHAARVMRNQGSGSIINTASTAGMQGGLGPHVYTAAKHAVVGLTKSTAVELVQHGIRVNAVAPGGTLTEMVVKILTGDPGDEAEAIRIMEQRSPNRRAPMPADVASVFAYLGSDESWYVNGTCVVVDGTMEVLSTRSETIGLVKV